jgi:hypothetical protein
MNTKDFLKKVVGDGAWYCALAIHPNGKVIQKLYPSIDEVVTAATAFEEQGFNAFFGTATYKTPDNRTTPNTDKLRSFFLDIDCGPSYTYTTQAQGIKALRDFCIATSMPRPLIVNSGRGLHVYWLLTEQVPTADWMRVAAKFKKVCQIQELAIDFAVPADPARVLRVPNTSNFKATPKLPVEIIDKAFPEPISLEDFEAFLGDVDVPEGLGFATLPVESGVANATMQALIGSSRNNFKEIVQKSLRGTGCEQLKIIISDQPACSEPLWRAGLSIAKFCDDPDKGIHNISKRHPEYSFEATERKASEIKGPYTCAVFNDNSPDICKDCPHWNKITSPIQLGKYIAEASPEDNIVEAVDVHAPEGPSITYEIPVYPKPYFRGVGGGVFIRKKKSIADMDNDEDGDNYEDVSIYHNDLYVVKRLKDVEAGECVVMRLHLPRDGVQEFMLPLASVTSKEELRKELSKQGVAVVKMDALLQYITTWINQLQVTTMAENAHRMFGWVGTDFNQFISGPFDIRPDKVLVNHASSATAGVMDYLRPRGTMEKWKEAIAFYDKPGFEMHQFVVCRALGSLLMAMTTYHGSNLHMYSKDSGHGKTTSAYAGLSFYGDPVGLTTHQKDTMASRMNRAEVYHNLMLLMDEVTNAEGKELSDLNYQITDGKQRNRMTGTNNTERHRAAPWKLLSVTTGNTSIMERIRMYKTDPKAEAQRNLECEVPKLFDVKNNAEHKQITDAFNRLLAENYGHGIIPFIQHVMKDPNRVQRMIEQVMRRVDTSAGLGPENRFWSVDVTVTLVGGLVAQEIGLIPYNMKALYKYTIDLIRENRRTTLAMGSTTQETLNEFIYEHMANMLQLPSTVDLRNGTDQLVVPNMVPKGALVIRYETDRKRAYIIAKNLHTWCGKQQINYNSYVKDLIKTMGGKREKIRLSKGTALSLPPTNVISVDCDIPTQAEESASDE